MAMSAKTMEYLQGYWQRHADQTIGFDTLQEKGCIWLGEPDEGNSFVGIDSDGVECSFSLVMIQCVYILDTRKTATEYVAERAGK